MTEATTPTATREIVMSRHFEAPRRLIWQAWTEEQHYAAWFGPHGSTIEPCTLDVRPGGTLHFCHRVAEVGDVWVRGTFDEVIDEELLVMTVGFSDVKGNDVERPGFPLRMQLTVRFSDEGGGTRLSIHQTGLVVDQGESQGWEESMERLAAHLSAEG